MSWKSGIVLAVLAVALGGFFVYDSYWLTPARDKAESVKGRLWTVEPKDVDTLTIKRQADTIQLKRVEGGWELVEPVKARGDGATANEVLTSLTTLRVDREIDPNPAKLAEFGLDPAAAEVRLDVKGRKEPLRLQLGGKSPTGAWVYAKDPAKPAVMTVSEVVGRDAARPVGEFRDKTLVAFDKKAVSGLDLDVEGNRASLVTDGPNQWRITAPSAYRADGTLVADFLDKLEAAKVKEWVAPGPPARYGFDHPAVITVWTGKDKDRASKTVRLGRVDAEKKGIYAMRDGDAEVMLVPEELWTAVPKTVAILRDKTVIPYAYDKANRVEVDRGDGRVVIERDGAAWKITAPEALKADSGAVNALLWSLRDLRASGFLGESAADVTRLIKKPEVTVKIWEEGRTEPQTLVLQASAETRGGRPAALAGVEGQGPVALVDARALSDLAKTAADLRDKSVLPGLEVADVQRARIAIGGKPFVVERSGASDWRVVEPTKGAAKSDRVTNLLLTLRSLRWKDIAAPKGEDAARFGLDAPALEVSLAKPGGASLATLQVGKQDGPVTYVRTSAGPAIYAVDSALLSDLRKAPTDIPG